ncbi:FkbM family methyltransferase [Planktomarina temperata]|nr:FkbM family methyltransferase [Planktomarina temperata]
MIFRRTLAQFFRNYIKFILFNRRLSITRLDPSIELAKFIDLVRLYYVPIELMRVGPKGDGGYLVPSNLEDIEFCFSPGVSDSIFFEKQLLVDFNISSFLIDGSIDELPENIEQFHFDKLYLGTETYGNVITLSDWISSTIGSVPFNGLLQMDIEGAEYEVLAFEDISVFNNFAVIVIEFHNLNKLFDPVFLKIISSIFKKLFKTFSICHLHPNNCCGISRLGGLNVPNVLEVTLIRNDFMAAQNTQGVELPHTLDDDNVLTRPSIKLPKEWWSKTL